MKARHLRLLGSLVLIMLISVCISASPRALPVKEITLVEILYDSYYFGPYNEFGLLDAGFWSEVQEPLIAAVKGQLTAKGYSVTDRVLRNRASGRSFPSFVEEQLFLEDEWEASNRRYGVLLTLVDTCQAGATQSSSELPQGVALLAIAAGLQVKQRGVVAGLILEDYVTVAAIYLYQPTSHKKKPRELWRGQSEPCTTPVPMQSKLPQGYTAEDRQARLRCLMPAVTGVLSELPPLSSTPRK